MHDHRHHHLTPRVSSRRRHTAARSLLPLAACMLAGASVPSALAAPEVLSESMSLPITTSLTLDIDDDGTTDFHILRGLSGGIFLQGLWPAQSGFRYPVAAPGDVIGPPSATTLYLPYFLLVSFGFGGGDQLPQGPTWVGLRFEKEGTMHYGWLRIQVVSPSFPSEMFITEIGWETEPETPVMVGWIDCDENGINDLIAILETPSLDCNGNLLLDSCERIQPGEPDPIGTYTCPAAADLDRDGTVNASDLGILIGGWGTPCTACQADLNRDGGIDGADLAILLSGWG